MKFLDVARRGARAFAALLADHAPQPIITIQAGPATVTFQPGAPPPEAASSCHCPLGSAAPTCIQHGSLARRR